MAKKDETLVVVESPAKAKTISKYLGDNYKVEASMGHVIDLPKSKLGVDIEDDFTPNYITIRGKGKVLKRLRKAVKKSESVLLATDPDREGEAISWHLSRALKLDEDRPRIVFNEITEEAINKALESPRGINKNLVNAQQARRVLDRLVGYKLSPLLWKKVRRGLSAGRVQTVAVKIICEREREIKAFDPDEYWTIDAHLKREEDQEEFTASLHRIGGEKFNLSSEEETDRAVTEIKQNDFIVDRVKKSKRKRNPKPPFTTSTLQQRAASIFSFSAKKTMFVAQQLYEGIEITGEGSVGLISYMRTDSTRVSQEAKKQAAGYIKGKYGSKYYSGKSQSNNSDDNVQDAHEAVRPTSVNRTPADIKNDLNRDQYRLYKLIWERFVASQMSPAIYQTLTIDIQAGDKYQFRASGSKMLFPGFLKVNTFSSNNRTEIPELAEGEKLQIDEIETEQHFTSPPPRFTEARLVKTLEEEGIGRPSTYAPTISTILDREYVEKEGNKLVPTDLGFTVNDLLVEYFPDVTDVEFTARIEKKLDKIEEGEIAWRRLLSEFYQPFQEKLENAEKNMEKVEYVEKTDETCEKCGGDMVVKYGRYGKFLACSNYPECENTKPYLDKTGVECPACEDGELVRRRSKKGKKFYGCSNYPDCDYMLWDKPISMPCPECGGQMVEKYSRRHGEYVKCVDCGHTDDKPEEMNAEESSEAS